MNATNEVDIGHQLIEQELAELLGLLELPRGENRANFCGVEPIVRSPLRIPSAIGVAAAAQALGIAAIWQARTGRTQTVEIDLHAAAAAVNSTHYLKQNGHNIGLGFSPGEVLSGYYRTADQRWMRLIGSRPRLRDNLLELLECGNTKRAISKAVMKWNAQELEDKCAELGLVGTMVRTQNEWAAHPQGRALASQPIIKITKVADSAPVALAAAQRPLSGIRVVETSHVLAGPGASRTLAEQGADVLRISSPWIDDQHYMVLDTGFGKRTAFIDLGSHNGQTQFRKLIADADVYVNSFRPGALDRHSLSQVELTALKPGLITLNVDCYGDGPWAGRRGFDPNAQAVSGANLEPGADQPSGLPTTLLADYLCSFLGAAGVTSALLRRAREGGSYEVRVSLTRAVMWVQGFGTLAPAQIEAIAPGMPPAPSVATMDSPFGELEYLPPLARYSETKAYWNRPPLPLGACLPVWQ